ncbi:MAG: hypothetical protein LBU69_03335 [Deltaproteobacteria bacterium]|nr:hypothetical protein [Deltaproteobacteria bacterium]
MSVAFVALWFSLASQSMAWAQLGAPAAEETVSYLGQFWESLSAKWLALDRSLKVSFIIGAVILALIAIALVAAAVFRGRLKNQPLEKGSEAQVGLLEPLPLNLSPPDGLFPGQWFERIDKAKVDAFLGRAKRETVRGFRQALSGEVPEAPQKPPAAETLSRATEKLAFSLNGFLTAPELFEALNGGDRPGPTGLSLLSLHLNALLPPIKLPGPEVSPGEIKTLSVSLMALMGAVAGNILVGAIDSGGQGSGTAALVGSAVGAFFGASLAVFLAQNERARRWLLAGVGGLAFFDALSSIFQGALLPGFLSLGRDSFFKRLLFYLGAIIVLILVKGRKAFDLGRYMEAVESRVEEYLNGALPLHVVLMYRLRESEPEGSLSGNTRPGAELAGEVAFLVSRMRAKPELENEPLFSQLVRKLDNAGFETKATGEAKGPRVIEWDDSLADRYEPFGLIEKGNKAVIEEEPVFKDGKVIRKGQAVPV